MGLSTAPSLFYFEVGFSWIVTSPLPSLIVTYTDGFFGFCKFMLLIRLTQIKRSLEFSPMCILSSVKGLTGSFIGGGKSIYLCGGVIFGNSSILMGLV
jgi:hypothetical protein